MAGSYLDLLGATPDEQLALQRIAQLRGQGFTDEEIFGGGLAKSAVPDSNMRLGGGSAFLPSAVSLAGITSQYRLGRGNLARDLINDQYTRQQNPFNIVTALQQYADSGQSDLLNNNTLKNIQPGPASQYQGALGDLFPAGGGATSPPAAAGGASPGAGAYYGFNSPEEAMAMRRYFDAQRGGIGTAASVTPQLGGAAGGGYYGFNSPEEAMAMRKYFDAQQQPQLGTTGTGQGGTSTNGTVPISSVADVNAPEARPTAPTSGYGSAPSGAQTAQMGAGRLLGQSLNVGLSNDRFKSTLLGGGVPGLGSLTEEDYNRLSPDQQGAYQGLLGSTGRVSDPAAAIAAHNQRYGMGGLQRYGMWRLQPAQVGY